MTINVKAIVSHIAGTLVVAAITVNATLLWQFNARLIRIETQLERVLNDNHLARR